MNELPGDHEANPDFVEPGLATAVADDDVDSPEQATGGAQTEEGSTRYSEALSFLKELPFLIVGALIVAVLVKSFLIQVFWIPSGSMEDTLQVGDRVVVNKLAYRIGDPGRGDVVVFEPETFESQARQVLMLVWQIAYL